MQYKFSQSVIFSKQKKTALEYWIIGTIEINATIIRCDFQN